MPFNSFAVTKSGLGRRLYQAHDIIVNLTVVAPLRPTQLMPRCVEIESADLRKVRATPLAISNRDETHSVKDSKVCAGTIHEKSLLSDSGDTNGRIFLKGNSGEGTVSKRIAGGIERDTGFRQAPQRHKEGFIRGIEGDVDEDHLRIRRRYHGSPTRKSRASVHK